MASSGRLACSSVKQLFSNSHEWVAPGRQMKVSHLHTLISRCPPRLSCCRTLMQRPDLSKSCMISVVHKFSSTDTNGNSVPMSSSPSDVSATPYIPPPPVAPGGITYESTITDITEALGEPTFASLGLGGWWPVGIVQSSLEFLHIGLDLPWFVTIIIGTIVVKSLMFPVVVYGQRNSAIMNNSMPKMQEIQARLTEARKCGDNLEAQKLAYELMMFMKERNINPVKAMLTPFMQAPVFLSFFVALRRMANLPVQSMAIGGMYWFTNLTIPDPFYILPLITSATLFLTIELGLEGGVRADNMQLMKYVLRCMPLIILPFTINFSAAVLCYWMTSNFFSLAQVAVLRLPRVRKYFKIELLIKHPPKVTPLTNKSFTESFKDSWTNSRIARDMEDRHRLDEVRFRKAGMGPIQKTYRYDPTKQGSNVKTETASSAASVLKHPIKSR